MSLFQSLKINSSGFYRITYSSVCVVTLLQLATWYPALQDAQSEVDQSLKRKAKVEKTRQEIQQQAYLLQEAAFLNHDSWINHHIDASKGTVPTQWTIAGSASMAKWQALLEKVEEHIALALLSVYWQKQPEGRWRGRLSFYIKIPSVNREYHNWLPTKLQSHHFVEQDWRILSTMGVEGSESALLEYKRQRYWVRHGSWLASVGLIVDTVAFGEVHLMGKDGSRFALSVGKKGGAGNEASN